MKTGTQARASRDQRVISAIHRRHRGAHDRIQKTTHLMRNDEDMMSEKVMTDGSVTAAHG